jgi:hypothetical protein
MEYFAVLSIVTAAVAALALVLYRQQRDLGILAGIAALYYWSLFGSWYIVIDKTGGFSGKYYHYLETKMFPIALDSYYLRTIVLYSAFIIAVELTLLLLLPARPARPATPLLLRHSPVLVVSFAAALGSVYIIEDKVSQAWALNTSAYWYTRTQTDEWFSLHQVLNRAALLPAAIGFASLLAGERTRYFFNLQGRFTMLAYVLLLGGMGVFTFVLGNKNEIFVALLTGLLAYLGLTRRANLLKVGASLGAGLWFLYAIDFFRSVPVTGLRQALSERLDGATEVGRFLTSSNEAYAAHFSMYGVLAADVPPRFGYSFYALVCSIVPRVIWPDRPRDIYLYYSESVGAIQNQGYSLHHATGWYLNFGYAGVLLGGIVLGLVWVGCIRLREHIRPGSSLPLRVFAVVAPWLFVAYIAPLIRAGPEGYKGFAVEAVLIPLFSLTLACTPSRGTRGIPLRIKSALAAVQVWH